MLKVFLVLCALSYSSATMGTVSSRFFNLAATEVEIDSVMPVFHYSVPLYDNYAALGELHDAGRISDEDFEKAGRDFAEKREAASAEYNACQGPWPYQWDNADVVVCGILQRFGLVSCDFYDLKYLY